MKHPRQAIREAIKAALVNRTPAAGRVMTNRRTPLSQSPSAMGDDKELPAILIFTRDESSVIFDESPRRYRRTATVEVEAALEISPTTALDDDLDTFALQIETLMLLDDMLSGAANDTRLTGTGMTIADTGAKLIGAVILTFEVEYFTYAVDETARPLDHLSTIDAQYSLTGEQPNPDDRAQTHLEHLDQ